MSFHCAQRRAVCLLCLLTCALIGCESTEFLPPPEPSSPGPAPEAAAKSFDLILDRNDHVDHEFLVKHARIRAAFHKVMLEVASLAPDDPPAKQAELIRAAVARHSSAIVVRPVDAPETAAALQEAQAQGVPLVLLDRPVSSLSEASPVTLVTYAPFAESATQLVAAVKAAAKRDRLREDGVAVLLVNTITDPRSAERVEALKRAIANAGLTLVETVMFTGISQHAQPPLVERLAADPRVTMVFADEDRGTASAHHTACSMIEERRFTVAGYTNFTNKTAGLIRQEATAVADRNELGFIEQAIDAAVSLGHGERVPSRIEIAHPVDVGKRPPSPLVK